ncbi:uncharacterized protein LOC143067152 [Mytilus galloprovincialis]|uniref:uncharacterized protein LOC143067152 n=1 Tax=Mytilus galloprovincialis TaxID=29158 RepID=UPI003F7CA833
MNNNIQPGLSCDWNGQKWTPTVTNIQEQWIAQNPPGVARGKVWQPKVAPPLSNPLPPLDTDDMSDESLENAVANGYPLDLSTFNKTTVSHTRQVESPLDLSLKTRKRCADSTLPCNQYGQIGKKMCLPSQSRPHGRSHDRSHDRSRDRQLLVQQAIADNVGMPNQACQQYTHTVDLMHPESVRHKRDYHTTSRQHMQNIDSMHVKHSLSSAKNLQNVQTVQHKIFIPDQTEVRQRCPGQTFSRQYVSSSNQIYPDEISKVSSHHYGSSVRRASNSQIHDAQKFSNYSGNNQRESQHNMYREHSQFYAQRQEVLSQNRGISTASKNSETNNYQLMSQVQKNVSNSNSTSSLHSSKYLGNRSQHDPYGFVRHNNAAVATYSPSGSSISSRSPSFQGDQSRPSVLSSGLHFKHPQECCSPDSTNVLQSPSDYMNPLSRDPSANSPGMSRDTLQIRRNAEMKSSRVSSTSYTPSSSPRCGYVSNSQSGYVSSSPNMISNIKSPSIQPQSKLTSSPGIEILETTSVMQRSNQSRSIIMGTSGSAVNDIQCKTINKNRPRLWNPDQLKNGFGTVACAEKSTFEVKNEIPKSKLPNNDLTFCKNETKSTDGCAKTISPETEFTSPLEIAIPKTAEIKSENRPKPFSKKDIIMNAFRNDESMKHILEERKPPPPPIHLSEQSSIHPSEKTSIMSLHPPEQSSKHPPEPTRSTTFISPESPKMPTLSPQQKLPAPKVSPLMGEPPTLDIAASQGNRRKQNKVSPNRKMQLKHSSEKLSNHNEKQDYSIQPHSSFPQRPKQPYKRIPVANVAPMVHGRCNSPKDKIIPMSEKGTPSQDIKQFVSIPTPQPIQVFRVETVVTNQNDISELSIKESSHIKSKEDIMFRRGNPKYKGTKPTSALQTNKAKRKEKTNECSIEGNCPMKPRDNSNCQMKELVQSKCLMKTPDHKNVRKQSTIEMPIGETNDHSESKSVTKRPKPKQDIKQTPRKLRFISNTKRKADEISRKARVRNVPGSLSGSMHRRRIRRRLQISKHNRGFIDFKPQVLESRTRRKSAVRRGYHRNAAYEKELRREEKRKAFRHRQRVHRFNKRISMKAKARKVVPPTKEKAETKLPEQNLEDATPSTVETDNSGTWEVKNTSTTLRNGKSKGVSMKILFKPQEQRRFRRRMRKRGTMRYGLKKTVSAPSRLRMQTKIFDDAGCSQGFSGSQMPCMDIHSAYYSQYDFDATDPVDLPAPVPFIPSLPEVKKLSVCKDTGETILHRAARMGHEDVALSYLQTGIVDVNVRDNAGYTPLHESCVSGNMVIARMLLSYGAMVNCASQDGIRPIHDAVDNDFVPLVRLLLSFGADPTLSTYGGKTPLKISHSKKMKSLIQGYLGDINGFNEESDLSVWEFCAFQDNAMIEGGIFNDIPSDPESDDGIFMESDTPLFQEISITHPISNERQNVVLLKDVTELLHMKTGDLLKDKTIKTVIIEDAKEAIQSVSELTFCYERLHSVCEGNCRLLQINDLNLVFSRSEKKKFSEKHDKGKMAIIQSNTTEDRKEKKKVTEKDKRKLEKIYDFGGESSSMAKSPKHKPSLSYHNDF